MLHPSRFLRRSTRYLGPRTRGPRRRAPVRVIAVSGVVLLTALLSNTTASAGAGSPGDNLCTGAWNHPTAAVLFQRAPGGTLAWSFNLTTGAITQLGPTATVTMPFAYVDGRAINPPYQPHTQPSAYNFHGSMNRFQVIGGGVETVRDGQNVTLFWLVKGTKPAVVAERYITCKIPGPGKG